MIEAAKQITNKYFVITPQTSKVGDSDWDKIVNPKYLNIPYSDYLKVNVFDIRHDNKTSNQEIEIDALSKSKFAGWFDLYNKNFYEKFAPSMEDWNGYGPWDTFSMITAGFARENYKTQINQYIIRNQIIFDINIKNKINVYKKYIKTYNIDDQRNNFEKKMIKSS